MSLEEIQRFVEFTRESCYEPFKSIIISGGEPLLWDHLEDGVRILAASGLSERLNIFSNGINTQAVTAGLLENITTLRLSKYIGNQARLGELVARFGTGHINIVDRTNHTPIPAAALDHVLPAKCGCEGYALCDGVMYACPMVPAVAKEMHWSISDFPEAYQPLWPHWAEALAEFDRANHVLCRACIGNHRVRAKQAKMGSDTHRLLTKQDARSNLLNFKNVMAGLGLPFFLMEGTLLGAYRDGDFVKGDEDDIDIGMMEDYYTIENIDRITGGLHALGFELIKKFTHPETGTLEGIAYKRGTNHIDVFAIHIKGDDAFMLARGWGRPGFPPIIAYMYPIHCFQKFGTIQFLDTEFAIPNDVEAFLSARYADWKTPQTRAEYDSHDPKQCPCIRTEW